MKTQPASITLRRFLCFPCLFAAISVLSATRAADEKIIAAVRAADDARVAATKSADSAALAAIYSRDLHYAHSNGRVDNAASQLQGVISGSNKYDAFDYKERTFVPAAPGIVLMKGRVLVHMTNKTNS